MTQNEKHEQHEQHEQTNVNKKRLESHSRLRFLIAGVGGCTRKLVIIAVGIAYNRGWGCCARRCVGPCWCTDFALRAREIPVFTDCCTSPSINSSSPAFGGARRFAPRLLLLLVAQQQPSPVQSLQLELTENADKSTSHLVNSRATSLIQEVNSKTELTTSCDVGVNSAT